MSKEIENLNILKDMLIGNGVNDNINDYVDGLIDTIKQALLQKQGVIDKDSGLEFNKWYPIEEYYKRKDKLDWALVQFEETKTGFKPLPKIAVYKKNDRVWATYTDCDRYLCEMCEPIAFMLWTPFIKGLKEIDSNVQTLTIKSKKEQAWDIVVKKCIGNDNLELVKTCNNYNTYISTALTCVEDGVPCYLDTEQDILTKEEFNLLKEVVGE